MRYIIQISLIFVMLAMTGCNLLPFRIKASNPPAFSAVQVAASSDRTAYGFTPIPAKGNFFWENRPAGVYDAMLCYCGDPSRPIALQKTSGGCT
jgi:hypothetical protein